MLQAIRNQYEGTIVKLVRKFEKVDFEHRKEALNLNFLQTGRSFNVIPNFSQFVSLPKVSEDRELSKSVYVCNVTISNNEKSILKCKYTPKKKLNNLIPVYEVNPTSFHITLTKIFLFSFICLNRR